MSPIFENLVAASGLSPIFARSTMKRACERAGIPIETMNRADLTKALPSIRRVLETFLPPADVDARMRIISKLATPP
jgi:hypothetical protein